MRRLVTLCVSMTVLAGCATMGPDFERPAAPQAQSYAMRGDAAPNIALTPNAAPVQWWRAFGSQQLDALVEQALANNHTLAAADAALARARAAAHAARGEAGPRIDAHAGVQRERINTAAFGIEGFPSPTISLYSVGAAASFDFDLFGGGKRRIESAEARAQAQAARTDAAYLTLTGDVVMRAAEIASLRAQIATLEEVVRDDRRTLDMIERGIEAGGFPRSASVAAQAELAEDETQLPPLRSQLAAARHGLALLVGRSPSEWTAPDIDLASLTLPSKAPLRLPAELVRKRPDILVAEAQLHAATADVGVAVAALYPQLTLAPDFAHAALKPENVFNYASSGWAFGPSVTAPLFHGGALRARKNEAEAARQEAMAVYQQTVLGAFVQVADLLAAIAQDQALADAQARATASAEENVRLARLAYENGAGSLVSVLDAQRQSRRARLGAISADARLKRDLAALFVATAADWRAS